jgi:hypothetical protein
MTITPDYLFVGGWFTSISNATQSGFARFSLVGGATEPPPVPTIASFSPTAGPVGTSVVVQGTGLTNASAVTFGTVPASSFTVDSDTQVTAVVPAGFNKAIIKITTPGGVAKSTGMNFQVTTVPAPPPVISSFSPTSGPVGTAVTVQGSGFTGATEVFFGTVPASFTVDNDTQITAIVPSGFDRGIIKVTAPGGKAKSTGMNFRVTT